MASAVVGTLRVLLEANAANLEATFDKATIKVGDFDRFSKNAIRNLTTTVAQFSGQNIVAEATRMAAAVEKVGGVSSLTAREIARVTSVTTEATAKLKALGAEVPPSIQKLSNDLKTFGTTAVNAGTSVQSLGLSFGRLVGGIVTAQAVIGTAKAAFSAYVDLIRGSVESYANAEAAQSKVTAALRAQGNATPEVRKQFADLAAEFQRTTAFSDDLLMEMEALLVQVGGVLPAQMEAALKAATDLSAGLGIDLRTATMLVGKAFEGNTDTLKRYGIIIDEAKFKTEGMSVVLDAIQEKFGGQAQAEVATYAGQLKQLANAWDDVKEGIGGALVNAPEIQVALSNLTAVLKDMTRESGAAETTVGALWQAWERYIEIGRTLTPGMMAWNRLLNEQADAAERARMAAQIPAPASALSVGPALPNISGAGMALFDQQLKDHKKELDEAKKAAEAFKRGQDALFGRDLITRAADFVKQLGDVNNISKLTTEKKAELKAAVDKALAAYQALGLAAPKILTEISAKTTALITATRDFGSAVSGMWVPLKEGAQDAGDELQNIAAGFEANGNLLSRSLKEAGQRTAALNAEFHEFDQTFGVLLPKIEALGPAIGEGTTAAQRFGATFSDALQSLGPAIIAAIQGGGSIVGTIGSVLGKGIGDSVVASFGSAITGALGKTLGGAINALIPGVGALLGPLFEKIVGFFGISREVKEARSELEKFQSTLRGTLTDTQKAEAGTEAWRQDVVRVRDAYLATGRTAAEAERIVRQLWDTDNPERMQAAIAQINRVLEEEKRLAEDAAEAIRLQAEAFADAKDEAGSLVDQIVDLAASADGLPKSIGPYIDRLLEAGLITEELAAQLRGLRREGEVDWEAMQAAAERYGVDLDSLGGRFQGARLHRSAQEIINDFGLLTRGGADVGGVLLGMSDEIANLVRDSIKFGTTIPANMRPWIQELSRSGRLLDENGNKIENLDKLNFGEELKDEAMIAREGFAGIIAKLDELIARITGPLTAALDNITKDRTVNIDVDYRFTEPPIPRDDPTRNIPFSRGGLVTSATRALIGEAGPELVIPLSRLGALVKTFTGSERAGFSPDMRITTPPIPDYPRGLPYGMESRLDERTGNRDAGGDRNVTVVAVPVFIDNPHDLDRIAFEVNRSVKETFADDFALDQYALSSRLVPLLADRLRGKVR